MTPSEPDPPRSSPRATTLCLPELQITRSWTRLARSEYSLARADDSLPTAVHLNTIARRATNAGLLGAFNSSTFPDEARNASTLAVDLSFVSDREMQQLNSDHRAKDRPTDVLSFSQIEGEAFPVGEYIALGDVIVSIETALGQARELKHSLSREVAFLFVHGTLHLCGFDHQTASQRRAMWKLQDAIVGSLNIDS